MLFFEAVVVDVAVYSCYCCTRSSVFAVVVVNDVIYSWYCCTWCCFSQRSLLIFIAIVAPVDVYAVVVVNVVVYSCFYCT